MTSHAAIYCRISSDKTGEAVGVARQEALCREYAALKGWNVSEVLVDNDVSATTGKPRPQWERLLAGLQDGTYDGVVSYHVDRLYRSLTDLVKLLELHKSKAFALGTVAGDIDLSTDMGRTMAGLLGVIAAGEVERKNQRSKDANKARALNGKTLHKYRIFGWQDDNVTLDPIEAQAIREGYKGLIEGSTSLGELGRLWTEQGLATRPIKNKSGVVASGVWSAAKVRLIFQRERNAGRAVHLGKVVGVGEWEPIISEADHDLLMSIFANRTVDRDNRRKHALSGLPRCGRCNGQMFVTTIAKRLYYVCKPSGHLGVTKDSLDYVVMTKLTAVLANPDSQAVKSLNLADTLQRIRTAQEALQALSQQETELGEADLPINTLKAAGAKLAAKRATIEQELASLIAGDRVASLISGLSHDWKGSAKDALAYLTVFHERWNALAVTDQHLILSSLLEITVNPETNHKGDPITRADRRVAITLK